MHDELATQGAGGKRRRAGGARAFALALTVLAAAPVEASGGPRAELRSRFTETHVGAPTALILHIVYRAPNDSNAKPSPIRRAEIATPPGTRFDATAVGRCTASDAELMLLGRSACPADSRVGSGTIVAVTGFGAPVDPFFTDVTLFSSGDGVIELVQQRGTNQTLAIDRATVRANVYTSNPPRTPGGPPDGETAVRSVDFVFDAPAPGKRAFITTPPSCPAGGEWVTVGRFTFDSALDVAHSAMPCSAAGRRAPASRPSSAPARPQLRVTPGRVARAHSRLRFRLSGSPPGCQRGAIVRLGGRGARTGSSGRAAIRARLRRPGPHVVVASKHGCPTARATVIVV